MLRLPIVEDVCPRNHTTPDPAFPLSGPSWPLPLLDHIEMGLMLLPNITVWGASLLSLLAGASKTWTQGGNNQRLLCLKKNQPLRNWKVSICSHITHQCCNSNQRGGRYYNRSFFQCGWKLWGGRATHHWCFSSAPLFRQVSQISYNSTWSVILFVIIFIIHLSLAWRVL